MGFVFTVGWSISLVPLPVFEKGDLDMYSLSPLWPNSHGNERENKRQKGAVPPMLAITGPGLQNRQQTALTTPLGNLKMMLCATRTIQKELPFFLHHIETQFLYNFRSVVTVQPLSQAPSHLFRKQAVRLSTIEVTERNFHIAQIRIQSLFTQHCTKANRIFHCVLQQQHWELSSGNKLWICSLPIGDLQQNTVTYFVSLCKASL